MTERLELHLLGPMTIGIAGRPVTGIASAKARAMLAYLAIARRPVSRGVLAGLLWSDTSEEDARRNLRVEILKLRQHLSGYLEISHQDVTLNDSCWADAHDFEAALAAVRASDASTRAVEIQTAANLYRGDFLQDFIVRSAPLFEEWLILERERFHQAAVQLLDRLIEVHIQSGSFQSGIGAARRLIAIDSWREKSHRSLMHLLALNGDRDAALAQYELLRRILAQEFAAEPSPETHDLRQRILTGSLGAPSSRPAAIVPPVRVQPIHHNLPAPTTGFVGREVELGQIHSLLVDEACRLITLTGPGGIGKTRLAQQAGWKFIESASDIFSGGIFFVSLAAANTSDILAAGIASVLDLTLHPQRDPWQQIVQALGDKTTLLILDNFESLVGCAPHLSDLLQRAGGCRLLVTSRQALDLYEEWVLPLEGLAFPSKTASVVWQEYSALQLFHQQARRRNLRFSFENQREAVVRLCQVLEGWPLGIELAAAWVHMLSCQEILDRLLANLDLPTSVFRNLPERQRSLRAVFQSSWDLLTSEERQALVRSSLFEGGFTLLAAERVTGCSARALASLVSKSLLRLRPDGRYEMHSLLKGFAGEFLDEIEAAAARQVHTHFYADLLSQLATSLAGPREGEALLQIEVEIDNLRAAWGWLTAQALENPPAAPPRADSPLDLLEKCIPMLSMFYVRRGWYREAKVVFSQTAAAVEQAGWSGLDPASRAPFILAQVSLALARHCQALGSLERARPLSNQSVGLFHRYPPGAELADAYHVLGQIEHQTGSVDAAQQAYLLSLEIYRRLEIDTGVASNLISLGVIAKNKGDSAVAQAMYHESQDIFRQRGDQRGIWTCLINLGNIANVEKDFKHAACLYQEALAIVQQASDPSRLALTLLNLGSVARETCDFNAALHHYQDSLNTSRQIGDRRILTASLDGLGKTHLKRRSLDQARGYLIEAAESAQQGGLLPQLLDSLASLGLLHLQNSASRSAFCILTAVLRHPSCPAHVKQDTAAALAEAGAELNLDEINHRQENLPSIEDIVRLALDTPAAE
jgi:DNA-binding SARP family transcriptional activator/predicted ATPase